MPDARYPILVERYTRQQSMTIVCEECHAEETLTGDQLLSEGLYSCPSGDACNGLAVYKYEEGDRCKSCQKLGVYEDALNGCCSRVCMLQAEYAASLKESA